MAINWATFIFSTASKCLDLAIKIAEIVRDKGVDGAGSMKLEDIDGWKEWSADLLKDEATLYFLDKLVELRENLKNG